MFFILPVLASFFWSSINLIDDYLVKLYTDNRSISILMIYSTLIGLPVYLIILIYINIFTSIPSTGFGLENLVLSLISGIVYIMGVYYYLKSLELSNASMVIPQLFMISVFSLLLGYTFLEERFSFGGLLGICLIIWGSILINIEKDTLGNLLLKRNLLTYALLASFFLSVNTFLFKYIVVIENVPYLYVLKYEHLGFFISGLFILFYGKNLNSFITSLRVYGPRILGLNITSELLNVIGNSIFHYATLYLPLAYAHTVADGTQPFIVILLSYTLFKLGIVSKNSLPSRSVLYITTCIFIMLVGLMCLYF